MNNNMDENILKDDRKNILRPVILTALVMVLLCGGVIWLGIRNPNFFKQIRDLIICMAVAALFLVNVLIIFLCVKLSAAVHQSRNEMKSSLNRADRTLDLVSEEINTLIQTVLEPVLGCQGWLAGIKHAFCSLWMKGKNGL